MLLSQECVAGGGERWWCNREYCQESDYAFVEAITIILLVILAMLFEVVHHSIDHFADRSYFYGKLQAVAPDSHGKTHSHSFQPRAVKRRIPLFKHWVNRLSKELMVLGFLAFLVFVFREAGGFEWLVKLFPPKNSDLMVPKTAEDWLHMVENVHMKLFLGMIIYFLVILRVVNGCVKHVEFWEEMAILRRNGKAEDATMISSQSTSGAIELNTRLQRYSRWCFYFTQSVIAWRETRPKLYEETLRRLKLLSCDTPTQSRVQRALDDTFPFSAYLAYSVRDCCKDTVDVHPTTWAAVLVLFSIFAIIHRYAKLILLHFMPVFIVGAFILIFAVGFLVGRFRKHVESEGTCVVRMNSERGKTMKEFELTHVSEHIQDAVHGYSTSDAGSVDPERLTTTCSYISTNRCLYPAVSSDGLDSMESFSFHERYSTEMWVFRALQIVLFVLSYACARTVGDFNDWRRVPLEVLATSSGFLVLFLLLGSLLPKHVPNFAALMAMPPYVDNQNVQTFFEVLDEYSADLANDGSAPPPFLLNRHRMAATAKNHTEVKKVRPRLDATVVGLTAQQHQLSGETDSQSALNAELAMMKLHMARLEGLVLSGYHADEVPNSTQRRLAAHRQLPHGLSYADEVASDSMDTDLRKVSFDLDPATLDQSIAAFVC